LPEDRIVREMEVLRWRDGSTGRSPDVMAEEAHVTVYVEPMGILEIVMAPESIREFILGHLYCEGLIHTTDQVVDITMADRGDRMEAMVELDPALVAEATTEGSFDGVHRRGLIQTECGTPSIWPIKPMESIEGRFGMSARVIASIPGVVRDRSQLFVETGAFHYAFLMDRDGSPALEAFDVGRHTAVDKVVGKALSEGTDPSKTALYTTGRISSDVARKCLRARIPLVISRGAPLTGAVGIARDHNLGMVGFLRGGRFNVYAGEGHIAFD
jgi:FdhD protein